MTHADVSSFDNDPAIESLNRNMLAGGEKIEEVKIVNYFGTPETKRFFVDKTQTQYFEYAALTEGGKAKYERATNKDIRVQRTTGDAKLAVDPATERQTLVKLSTVNAVIYAPSKATGEMQPLSFNPKSPTEFWDKVFEAFPPKIIQDFYKAIREENPWMKADEDLEALEIEHKNLGERIEKLREEKEKA